MKGSPRVPIQVNGSHVVYTRMETAGFAERPYFRRVQAANWGLAGERIGLSFDSCLVSSNRNSRARHVYHDQASF